MNHEMCLLGCRAYALVAWIWSFIWYVPLDAIKWAIAYVLNEDGFRDRMHGRTPATIAAEQAVATEGEKPSMARVSAGARPALGRTSVQVGAPSSPSATSLCHVAEKLRV